MPTTEKQIAANRRNAAKSTGPRTLRGKARSSRNALTHASLAQTVVLQAESAQSFNDFVAGFYAEYLPVTSTEKALVDSMVSARWRAIRACSLESANLDYEFSRQTDPLLADLSNAARAGLAYRDLARTNLLDFLSRSESRLQRQFETALDRLTRMRKGHEIIPGEPIF